MKAWLQLTGGLLIWAAHFLGIYLIASVGEVVAAAADPGWRLGGLVFSGVCALAEAALLTALIRAAPREGAPGFGRSIGVLGAVLGLIGIVWQSLPNLIV